MEVLSLEGSFGSLLVHTVREVRGVRKKGKLFGVT